MQPAWLFPVLSEGLTCGGYGEFQATFCPHVVLPCPGTIPPGGKVTSDTGLGAILHSLAEIKPPALRLSKQKSTCPSTSRKDMPTLLHSKVLEDFQWTFGCSSQAFSSRPNLKKSKGRRSNSSSQEICFLATEWVCFETPKSQRALPTIQNLSNHRLSRFFFCIADVLLVHRGTRHALFEEDLGQYARNVMLRISLACGSLGVRKL